MHSLPDCADPADQFRLWQDFVTAAWAVDVPAMAGERAVLAALPGAGRVEFKSTKITANHFFIPPSLNRKMYRFQDEIQQTANQESEGKNKCSDTQCSFPPPFFDRH